MPETRVRAEISTLCAFLDVISNTLDLNSAYFCNKCLFYTSDPGRQNREELCLTDALQFIACHCQSPALIF